MYLDSDRVDSFFEMASELGKPIFLHPPAEPVGSGSIQDFRLVEQVGRFMDVTVGLATLVFGGRMEQYPDLQFVAATAGGAISLLAGRMDQAYRPRHWAPGGPPGGTGPPRWRRAPEAVHRAAGDLPVAGRLAGPDRNTPTRSASRRPRF